MVLAAAACAPHRMAPSPGLQLVVHGPFTSHFDEAPRESGELKEERRENVRRLKPVAHKTLSVPSFSSF
jgi:hypothetical protein